jgi:hypothetical protein
VPVAVSYCLMVLPGMDTNQAKAVASVAHLVALLPPAILGIFSLQREQPHVMDLIPEMQTTTIPQSEGPSSEVVGRS